MIQFNVNSLRSSVAALLLILTSFLANAETAPPPAESVQPVIAPASSPAQVNPVRPKSSITQVIKERLVLMPLRLGEEDRSRQAAMETALVQGLQQQYEVFSGEQVSQKAREIFLKESHSTNAIHKECDETRCMQNIAEAFQAELIATANVSKETDGYFLALSIQNIFDNKVVFSNSLPCPRCNAYQVVEKLRNLVDASKNKSVASDEATDWLETKELNTEKSYKAFMDRHPDGNFNEQAKTALRKFAPYKPIGLYIGGQFGSVGTITGVKDTTSMGALFGYNLSDAFSVELGSTSLYKNAEAGVMASSINPNSAGKFSLSGSSLLGQYAFSLSDNTKLLAGLGFYSLSYTLDNNGYSIRSGKTSGLQFGLKAEYSLGKFFGLRAGLDGYNLGGDFKGLVTNISAAAILKF